MLFMHDLLRQKKPFAQNWDFGNILRWGVLMGGVQLRAGGLGNWDDKISVKGEKLLTTLSPASS